MPPDPLKDGNLDNLGSTSNNNDGDKKGKGGIIALVIILLLVGAATLVIVLDVGNVRTEHIARYLRNAPLIGGLFPEEEEDELEQMTEDEMRLAINSYRNQIASLEIQRDNLNTLLSNANELNTHLEAFRARWNEYRAAYAAFSQILAHNAPVDFVEFFYTLVDGDLIPHDQAIIAAAFAEAQAINMFNAELMENVRTMNNMEAGRAAEDLERLMLTDTVLAVRLLRAMSSSRRAEIFDEMEYSVSSTFFMLMSTSPPTFTPLVPPPALPEVLPPIATPPPTPIPIEVTGEEDDEPYEDDETNEENDEYEEETPEEEADED